MSLRMRFFLIAGSLTCLGAPLALAQTGTAKFYESTVRFVNGPDEVFMQKLDARFSRILTACSRGDMENCREYFTPDGYEAMIELQRQRPFANSEALYRPQFIQNGDEYEARGFRVLSDEAAGRQTMYLVFHLDLGGQITDVHFGLGPERYRELYRAGQAIKDSVICMAVKQFIDLLQHAYCVRNLDFITKAYSEGALIVVGRKLVESVEPESDAQQVVSLPRDKYEFIRRSKREYIERLAQIFSDNEFVSVEFRDVRITQHEQFPNIFGVQLIQRWESPSYSDEGYLFFAIRRTESLPIIEMRSWQPQPFEDGSVVGLKDALFLEPPEDNPSHR